MIFSGLVTSSFALKAYHSNLYLHLHFNSALALTLVSIRTTVIHFDSYGEPRIICSAQILNFVISSGISCHLSEDSSGPQYMDTIRDHYSLIDLKNQNTGLSETTDTLLWSHSPVIQSCTPT